MVGTSSSTPSAVSPEVVEQPDVLARYNVRVHGQGEQTLMFCNGLGCTQHIWQYLTPALALRYRLVLFDYPGTGEAQAPYDAQKYGDLSAYAQDVVDICRVLALPRIVLVGHSVGASIAMLAAVQAPTIVASVVMLAPSPCYLNKPGYHGGFDEADVEQLLGVMEADYDGWANMFANLLLGPTNPTLGEQLAQYFCQSDPSITQQFARVAFLSDNRADVPHLQARTLILQCAQDVAAPEEVGHYLHQHLPQATLVQLRATGHCPHLSAPLETLAAIENFLG